MKITSSDREEVLHINKVSSIVDIIEDIKIADVTLESMCNTFFRSGSRI